MGPSFSALLSVYRNDKASTLDECLYSLYHQTESLDEVIVVQEGEIGNDVLSVLEKWETQFAHRFTWHRLPFQNGPMGFGLPACLNYGITNAKSAYIMRVDTDDVSLPERVYRQKQYANENPEIKLFGCSIREFDEEMKVVCKLREVPVHHADILKMSKFRNPFNGQTVVFEKKTAIELGGYPNIPSNEDYCFWANFLMKGYRTGNIEEILVNVRAGDELVYRRSSKRYRDGEVESLKYLYSIGFLSTQLYYFHRLAKGIIRILPRKIIAFIYNRFLRS